MQSRHSLSKYSRAVENSESIPGKGRGQAANVYKESLVNRLGTREYTGNDE